MEIRDRIKDFRRVPASELRPNPRNWRTHPERQRDALRGVLAEIGYADALIARECPDGGLMLLDGHLRAETTPDQSVPVLVVDLDDAEAAKLLATLDPLAALAEVDTAKLDGLLREVQTGSEALAEMLTDLAGIDSGEPAELRPISTMPPPKMSWVLIGIPTVRFGEIAEDVERLAKLATICETTVNDG